jgi:hypothetical protein
MRGADGLIMVIDRERCTLTALGVARRGPEN